MEIGLNHYLVLSTILFCIGLVGWPYSHSYISRGQLLRRFFRSYLCQHFIHLHSDLLLGDAHAASAQICIDFPEHIVIARFFKINLRGKQGQGF